MLPHKSSIIITEDVEAYALRLKEELSDNRVVIFLKEKFLVEDAKSVIAEAYISEEREKYLILAAKEYNIYSQNALLKILEEPPKNIIFILISPSKSALLPTIRSRLPVEIKKSTKEQVTIELDIARLDLVQIFEFVRTHKNSSKSEAKQIIEALCTKALQDGVKLTNEQLENFDTAYRLLELNARVQSVLLLVLMGFLH